MAEMAVRIRTGTGHTAELDTCSECASLLFSFNLKIFRLVLLSIALYKSFLLLLLMPVSIAMIMKGKDSFLTNDP